MSTPPDAATRDGTGPGGHAYALSLAELQGLAHVAGDCGRLSLGTVQSTDPVLQARLRTVVPRVCSGLSELLNLSDDLLLIRSDFQAEGPRTGAASQWRIDARGWLYLHFRLDGLTCDLTPDGRRHTLGGGSFFLATSPQPQTLVREVLSDHWRVVTVAFRPSFADRDLRAPDAALPQELRRFQSGDAEAEFFYASQLTLDMSSAVRSLLAPAIQAPVRPIYLRAKVVELVCLAIEQLQMPAPAAQAPLKLSYRDTRALEEARKVLDSCTEPVSLDQLARRVGLNRRKLALGFKMLFGATVGEYHRDVRLETAYRMLGSATASVGYAAAVAGYSDVGSFGKAFRARYGCLPSDVRPSAAARRLGAPRK
jgi:AraC family transcriptional activator of pyochelin receptor